MGPWTVDVALVFKVLVMVCGGLLTILGLLKLLLGTIRRTAAKFAKEIVDAHGVECPVKKQVLENLHAEHGDFMKMFDREQTERITGRTTLAEQFTDQLFQLETRINERLDHLRELMDVMIDGRSKKL